jgi:hypothetical protein
MIPSTQKKVVKQHKEINLAAVFDRAASFAGDFDAQAQFETDKRSSSWDQEQSENRITGPGGPDGYR